MCRCAFLQVVINKAYKKTGMKVLTLTMAYLRFIAATIVKLKVVITRMVRICHAALVMGMLLSDTESP
jgi:hypothetical protein